MLNKSSTLILAGIFALMVATVQAGVQPVVPADQPALGTLDSTPGSIAAAAGTDATYLEIDANPLELHFPLPADLDRAAITEVRLFIQLRYGETRRGRLSWALLNHDRQRWVAQRALATQHRDLWQWFSLPIRGRLDSYIDESNSVVLRLKAPRQGKVAVDYAALAFFDASTPKPWDVEPTAAWRIQLSDTNVDPQTVEPVVDLDLFEVPRSVAEALHAQGRKLVCYFSAGSYEEWRPDRDRFPSRTKAGAMKDWPGERWLDVRYLKLIKPVMSARLDLATVKGCDGVDPDNVEVFENRREARRPVTAAHQLAFNRWLASEAHARGLAVGLKNDLSQATELVEFFDWELNEECFFYQECDMALPFVRAGKPVINIEYQPNDEYLMNVCPLAAAMGILSMNKELSLGSVGITCQP